MRTSRSLGVCALVSLWACASSGESELRAQQSRADLRSAMQVQVDSRERRDEQSKLLAERVERANLESTDRPGILAAFGPGKPCVLELCEKHGFIDTDWYYELGVPASDQVKQLPLLLVGFDPHDHVKRVFTLTTH